MVPADDERASANEPEDNTSTRRPFFKKLKFWKRCKQEDDEPARLSPMPPCLMKWWTPLLVAFILFALSFICALGWGWQWHWPSSKAMKLCMTITGAGLAFSAWQQRSSDNATRELERTTETLWHRRNTAHALLSANSIYEQQEGVCRYLELADELNKRSQKNETLIHIFNASILSALSAHIRYLGAPPPQFIGDEIARGELQNLILQNILNRVNTNLGGYWDGLAIDLTNITFLTTVSIVNFTSKSKLHLNKSHFKHKVNIEITNSTTFYWKACSFLSKLEMTGKSTDPSDQKPLLLNDNLPQKNSTWKFENIAFCILEDLEYQIVPGQPLPPLSYPSFKNCDFLRPKATQQHPTDVSADADTDSFDESETPAPPDNYIWATISFNFELLNKEVDTVLYFTNCKFARANPPESWHVSHTCFTRCYITQSSETEQKKIAPADFDFIKCDFASHANGEDLTTAQEW